MYILKPWNFVCSLHHLSNEYHKLLHFLHCNFFIGLVSNYYTQQNYFLLSLSSFTLCELIIKLFLQWRCQQWEINFWAITQPQLLKQLNFGALVHIIIWFVIIFLYGKIMYSFHFPCHVVADWGMIEVNEIHCKSFETCCHT